MYGRTFPVTRLAEDAGRDVPMRSSVLEHARITDDVIWLSAVSWA
jgi:hypothetical protein